MIKQNTRLARAGDLLARLDLPPSATQEQAQISEPQQTSFENLGHRLEQRETSNLIQLPLWYEPERGTPNSFLRSALFAAIESKDRQFLKGVILASSKDVSIKFTGEQLNQEDLSVWETLVHLARQHPLGNICQFTAHALLKTLGLHTGGAEHRRLHTTITRMIACAVEIKHERVTYIGSLIDDGMVIDDGMAIDDKPTKQYALRLNPNLIRLYGETRWTALNWHQRRQLRRKSLAQALHAYYSTHARPVPVKIATLRDYTGSRNTQPADFKRKVRKALTELVKIGFLNDYRIERDLVTVLRV
jgi:hypothetical protein